jgi:hypothetical protein
MQITSTNQYGSNPAIDGAQFYISEIENKIMDPEENEYWDCDDDISRHHNGDLTMDSVVTAATLSTLPAWQRIERLREERWLARQLEEWR